MNEFGAEEALRKISAMESLGNAATITSDLPDTSGHGR